MAEELVLNNFYFGAHEARCVVTAIDGDAIEIFWPISQRFEILDRSEMIEFMAGSQRRTYRHPDGEMRTRISDPDGERVEYLDSSGRLFTVDQAEWAEWRAAVAS